MQHQDAVRARHSYADTLIARAGDVTLKEGPPAGRVVRETPLHVGHLRQMLALAEMGAVVLPPVPAFYHRPKTIRDLVDHTVGPRARPHRASHARAG